MSTTPDSRAVARPAEQIRGFVTAPALDNVDEEDKPLLELIGVLVLDSQRPAQICEQWTVDSYARHYNVTFDLLKTAGPISLATMQLCKELNYVRVEHVFVAVEDGHLQLVVQVARASCNQVIVEEQILHIARVHRQVDPTTSVSRKRVRTGE